MLTLIGVIFVIATIWAVVFKQSSLVWILSAAAPFPATAALTFGENSVPPFYVVAVVATTIAIVHEFSCNASSKRRASLVLLVVFTAWAAAVTFFAPSYFQGIEVLVPRAGIDEQVMYPGNLFFSVSNVAQLCYLFLGVGVVWYLSQQGKISHHVLALGLGLGSVLSSVRYLIGDSFPIEVFDNYYGIDPFKSEYQGMARFRGIFPEPSYLAVFSLAAVAYFIAMAARTRGIGRAVYLALFLLAGGNVVTSYSGTAALGVLVLVGVAFISASWKFLFAQGRVAPEGMLAGLAAVCAVALAFPLLSEVFIGLFEDKQGSQSYANRMAADMFTFEILANTVGMGAGLGSSRPSSLLAMLASNVGYVGAGLFIGVIIQALRSIAPHCAWRPTMWALVGLLVAKFTAEPALSTPLLWLCLGLCVHVAGRSVTRSGEIADDREKHFKRNTHGDSGAGAYAAYYPNSTGFSGSSKGDRSADA